MCYLCDLRFFCTVMCICVIRNQIERSIGTGISNSFLQEMCQTYSFAQFGLGRGDWERRKNCGGTALRSESKER